MKTSSPKGNDKKDVRWNCVLVQSWFREIFSPIDFIKVELMMNETNKSFFLGGEGARKIISIMNWKIRTKISKKKNIYSSTLIFFQQERAGLLGGGRTSNWFEEKNKWGAKRPKFGPRELVRVERGENYCSKKIFLRKSRLKSVYDIYLKLEKEKKKRLKEWLGERQDDIFSKDKNYLRNILY